jgi:hypothetical protein
MTRRLLLAALTIGLLAAMLPGTALAGDKTVDYGWGAGPNQGEVSKVVLVPGPFTCPCTTPVPSEKYEGYFGTSVMIESDVTICGATVKSGRDAEFWLEYKGCGEYELYGTKDISNYVIWTCPCLANGAG